MGATAFISTSKNRVLLVEGDVIKSLAGVRTNVGDDQVVPVLEKQLGVTVLDIVREHGAATAMAQRVDVAVIMEGAY